MFVTLDDTKKNGPKTFVIARTAFFEMFDSINLLSPKEMILSFAQKRWNYLVDPYKLSPHNFCVRCQKKKTGQIVFFFSGKVAFSWKLSVFNNLLGAERLLL